MATTHQKVEQGARSREALLDAAIELIADGGYTATGVDAIARRSGVVKSALYWHFGSKDGLLIAALERTGAAQDLSVHDAVVSGSVRDGASLLPGLLVALDAAGVEIASAEVARPTLADVFLALTGRSLREAGAGPADPGSGDGPPHAPTPDTSTELQEQHS